MADPNRTGLARAFSLVELLVVVSIIALLITILVPSLNRARQQARSVVCLSNLGQMGKGAAIYMNGNRGQLPLSPAEKLQYGVGDGRMVKVLTTCHWGGRRAESIHEGPDHIIAPETEVRPLTRVLYPNANLDSPTPVFRCPSDQAIDWTNSRIPDVTVYRVCGNSYYINWFGESPFPNIPPETSTSRVAVYMEARLYELLDRGERGRGWHGLPSTHNVMFLDMHAAATRVDSRQRSGDQWTVSDFLAMSGFYP